jgi:hypothetical protein
MAHQNTIPTTTATSEATGSLPVANVRPADNPFPEEQFHRMVDVPVFTEHQTLSRDGRELSFGRKELEAITHRCNRRITQTGDYAAITIGHTPSPDAIKTGTPMPDLVGFAGPFKLGVLGNPGETRRYAILADFYVFKDEMLRVQKHPRRSPEVWLEDQYEEMFFDPIALLGSEAPRLDMGLTLYSAHRHVSSPRSVEKYTAAVAPAAGNVFVPTHVEEKQKYQPVTEEVSIMALSPQDVSQIVDAIEQLDWVQGVKGLLADTQDAPGSLGQGEELPPAPPQPEELPVAPPQAEAPIDAPPEAAAPPEAPPAAGPPTEEGPEKNVAPLVAAGLGAAAGSMMSSKKGYGADDDPSEEMPFPDDPEAEKNVGPLLAAGIGGLAGSSMNSKKGYSADEATGIDPEEEELPAGGSDVSSGPKKYTADDGEEFDLDDEDQEELKSYMARKYGAGAKKYQADGDVDGNELGTGSPTVEGAAKTQDGDSKPDGGSVVPEGEEREAVEAFSRMTTQLAHTQRRLRHAESAIDEERRARVNAERYSQLTERRGNYVFDMDREVSISQYSKMNDEQFGNHLQSIEQNYNRIPVDTDLRVFGDGMLNAPGRSASRPEDYNKQVSDRAYQICERRVLNGEDANYEEVVRGLKDGSYRE